MSGPPSPAPSRSTRPAPRSAVLFADDEEAIRWLGRRLLEADGWIVYDARDGEEALEIVETHPNELSLVVTDLNVPQGERAGARGSALGVPPRSSRAQHHRVSSAPSPGTAGSRGLPSSSSSWKGGWAFER
jgi:hypothetical protein